MVERALMQLRHLQVREEKRKRLIAADGSSSYREEKSEETLECGARDEIAMKVNKP